MHPSCVWLLPSSTMMSGFVPVVMYTDSSFLFRADWRSIGWICNIRLSRLLLLDSWLFPQLLTVRDKAALNHQYRFSFLFGQSQECNSWGTQSGAPRGCHQQCLSATHVPRSPLLRGAFTVRCHSGTQPATHRPPSATVTPQGPVSHRDRDQFVNETSLLALQPPNRKFSGPRYAGSETYYCTRQPSLRRSKP